jgi:hypothetical protein
VRTTQYSFATTETLTFAIPDNILSDNNGGLSVVISRTGDGIPADYNANGAVDAADYVLWRNGGPLQNEIATLGSIDAGDYAAWRARYGNHAGNGAENTFSTGWGSSVPEPTAWSLVGAATLLACGRRRQ